jgi:hypothetical protein
MRWSIASDPDPPPRDTPGVSSTRKKLDGPVRSGQWGLRLDNLVDPKVVTILRFADKSRHTRSFTEIGTFGFVADVDALADAARSGSEMAPANARTLARDLVAKVSSPRAREAAEDE